MVKKIFKLLSSLSLRHKWPAVVLNLHQTSQVSSIKSIFLNHYIKCKKKKKNVINKYNKLIRTSYNIQYTKQNKTNKQKHIEKNLPILLVSRTELHYPHQIQIHPQPDCRSNWKTTQDFDLLFPSQLAVCATTALQRLSK